LPRFTWAGRRRIVFRLIAGIRWPNGFDTRPEHDCSMNSKPRERTMNLLKKFLASEDGPTAVEYAVMLALIVVVCIGTITAVGTKVNGYFDSTKTALP